MSVVVDKANEAAKSEGVMVALKIPTDIGKTLAIKEGEPVENMHITLAYLGKLGELPKDVFEQTGDVVKKVCATHAPIKAAIKGVGKFKATEHSDGKDVIYAKVDGDELMALREAIVKALEEQGLAPKDDFKFTPHVTLAYVEPGKELPIKTVDTTDMVFKTVLVKAGDIEQSFECKGVEKAQPTIGAVHVPSGLGPKRKPKDEEYKQEKVMPYERNADLPPAITSALPTEAQTIFRNVFNSVTDKGGSEESGFAQAWGALKNQGWQKQKTGKWIKVEKQDGGIMPFCFFCDMPASKILLWSGGSQRLDVCAMHLNEGLHQIMDTNNSTVQQVLDIPTPPTIGESPMSEAYEQGGGGEEEEIEINTGTQEETKINTGMQVKIIIGKQDGGKTEDGKKFQAGDYAYVPDKEKPSTWKLRLTDTPGGAPDTRIVGAALAALGPTGFRGQKVQIPTSDLPSVKAKILAAWKKLHPDAKPEEIPRVLKAGIINKEYRSIGILKQDKEQRLVTGVVMEPDTIDTQGDQVSEDEIQKAAHKFLVQSRVMGLQHKKQAPIDVVESFIAPNDTELGGQQVKKGSWIMTVKVIDDELWKSVKKGTYTGFSIGGYAARN